MDPNTLLVIMAVFVAVAAIALLIQAWFLFGIYKASRALEENARRLLPKVEALVEASRDAVEDSRKQIAEITTRTADILDVTRRQLARVDEVLEDAVARARVQLDRAEMVLDDTMTRAQETVALVHKGILKPLKEINGVAVGIRTALRYLLRGRRPNPAQATADEEMFI
jgi:biopolymer transport protein ExbB/TolQ